MENILSKLWKNSVFEKIFSLILSSPKFYSLWRKSESFTIRSFYTHFYTKIMAYRIIVFTTKKVSSWCREEVYRFGAEKRCTSLVKKFVKLCTVVFEGFQNRLRKTSSGCLGTGYRSRGPNQETISCVCVCFSVYWIFAYSFILQVIYISFSKILRYYLPSSSVCVAII